MITVDNINVTKPTFDWWIMFSEVLLPVQDFSDEISFKFEDPFVAELKNDADTIEDEDDTVPEISTEEESTPEPVSPMELLLKAMQKLKEIEEKHEQEVAEDNLIVQEQSQEEGNHVFNDDINELLQSAGNPLKEL